MDIVKTSVKGCIVRAFTLLEVIIVVAAIAVISAVIIPSVSAHQRSSKLQRENDEAYALSVATQDYLNHLQKYGKNAAEKFGSGDIGGKYGCGTLVVDEGYIDYQYSFAENGTANKDAVNEAFSAICKNLGVGTMKEAGTGRMFAPEFYNTGRSFYVLVYPSTYTVACVWTTDYGTEYTANAGGTDTNHIMHSKIRGANSAKDSSGTTYCLWDSGFLTVQTTAPNQRSQEAATKAGNGTSSCAYMGQFPAPMNVK